MFMDQKHKIGAIVLAAGKGKRFHGAIPKVLYPLLGKPVLNYILDSIKKFHQNSSTEVAIGITVGHKKEMLIKHLEQDNYYYDIGEQKEQLGTAHAVTSFLQANPKYWDFEYTLICCGDTPLLKSELYESMYERLKNHSKLDAIVATFEAPDSFGYGRIVHAGNTFCIKEEKDASSEERNIKEVNAGLYLVKTSFLKKYLSSIENKNNSAEFYLTDLFQMRENVESLNFIHHQHFLGINNYAQLVEARTLLRHEKNLSLLQNGVDLMDPVTTYIDYEVNIGSGSIIYPNVVIEGKSLIAEDCVIESNCVIKHSVIGTNVEIYASSYLEDCKVASMAHIGPFARLRPKADIGENCKIGNFVEVKKSQLAKGVKVSHLSYVGDAIIGENTNIGCGFVTCNYDGVNKHLSKIGKNSFIGSDCQVVAPIEIGDEVYIGSGSTINKNVPNGAFAIARERQVNKEGMAKKFLPAKKEKNN